MAPKPKAKKGANFLAKKLGPAPVWVWVVSAIGVYMAYKYFSGSTTAAATTAPTTDTNGTTAAGSGGGELGSGGGSVTGSTPDTSGYSAYSDLVSQLESQNSDLLSTLLGSQVNYSALGAGAATGSNSGGNNGSGGGGSSSSNSSTASPYVSAATQSTIPASTKNFAQAASAKTAAAAATGTKVAFGGVVSTKKLKNGSTLTIYASGRQVEQAPGKSAYVVHP